ncbi:hypothetical protein LC605_08635 [Nostoc sp. CHAB 5836]|uniref:hypothetical protein n=1 Tax=Nostoc sp. CHAB 5836 TaxID=2780404 RepID=UPI001E508AF2|nr:hypothetical protein [Nostoc sp. CHAB 5836]MCC5615143.1 hypothetical protein [Nostoc sp. CHAB 5836]
MSTTGYSASPFSLHKSDHTPDKKAIAIFRQKGDRTSPYTKAITLPTKKRSPSSDKKAIASRICSC